MKKRELCDHTFVHHPHGLAPIDVGAVRLAVVEELEERHRHWSLHLY
jgi:hypothetical protein